ncbi:PREDICTED: uncharacterized protein At4g06744-like [Nelumbo nucifera]|uniref:Uncharacterized protein At4g06744-like n=1 Tax=Nelumbo nucifera TaxID=4432 RepID=A0A1U8ASI9_NELNU|nr:PREDICTED: uncharacterized protein At4g06744-like [Nelumbo nucifera]
MTCTRLYKGEKKAKNIQTNMSTIPFPVKSPVLTFIILTLLPCFLHALGDAAVYKITSREALEINAGHSGISGKAAASDHPLGEVCNCSPSPAPDLVFENQRLALVYPIIQSFKNIITSDPLGITSTWVGSDICNYRGFYCDNPPDDPSVRALAGIDFNGYQLAAPTLDGFIDLLPDLAIFHANTNNFTGIISPKIAQLRYLYELDISNNLFSGQFPTAVLGMNGLSFLDIRFNSFSGSVPAQIFTQPLDVLFINNNNFMQTLPNNLGNTPVRYLTFANNNFVGSIPRSIGNASATLVEVLFLNNKLSGCLPYEIGLLTSATVFDVGNNFLTGPIPCSFACLEKMEVLKLAGNQFYGKIPEEVCGLGNLANLSLSDNYFRYLGPTCRSLIKRGVLDVSNNCIHGLPNQRPAAECWDFYYFHLKHCPSSLPRYNANVVPCNINHSSLHSLPPSKTAVSFTSPSYSALVSHRRPPPLP